MRILALDVGDRRIGVALSDPLGILASPLTIIERRDEAVDIAAIGALVSEHKVGRVIAGMPLSLAGESGMQAGKVKAFLDKLAPSLDVPLETRDERFSTLTARELMLEAGAKGKKRRKPDDAAAAAVILQSYLDEHR